VIHHALDFANFSFVAGWAYSDAGPMTVIVQADGQEPIRMTPAVIRTDVNDGRGLSADRATGFVFFPFKLWPGVVGRLSLRLTFDDGRKPVVQEIVVFAPKSGDAPVTARTPFPADVFPLMVQAEPALSAVTAWSLADMEAGVETLRFLIDRGDRLGLPLIRYRRFLETMRTASSFALANILPFNTHSKMGEKDFWTLGTDLGEHMALSNYLYCLKSHGVEGDVAEFGCFKGLSSSVLSTACRHLGVTLHIYDSFGGLPASASPYYVASEFRGSLDEVRDNIERFGDLPSCEFHPGFFSDSMAGRTRKPLCLAWVDVDLESSAQDMAAIFDDLSPRGGVISNEAMGHHYDNGRIIQTSHTDAVLPVLLEALQTRFGPVRGDHLANCSGSLYAAESGLPVLPWAPLQRLLAER
jgi:O-methyltransferase